MDEGTKVRVVERYKVASCKTRGRVVEGTEVRP